jgi:hypothetical protein
MTNDEARKAADHPIIQLIKTAGKVAAKHGYLGHNTICSEHLITKPLTYEEPPPAPLCEEGSPGDKEE